MDFKLISKVDFSDFFKFVLKDNNSQRADCLLKELNIIIRKNILNIQNLQDLLGFISYEYFYAKTKKEDLKLLYSQFQAELSNLSVDEFSEFLKTITFDLSPFSEEFLKIDLRILKDEQFIPGLITNKLEIIGPSVKHIFENHRIYRGTDNKKNHEVLLDFIRTLTGESDEILNKYQLLTVGADITKGITNFSEDNLLQNLQIIYRNIMPNIQEKYNYQKIFELYFSENHPKLINLKNNDKKLEIIGHFIKPQKTKERIRQTIEGNSKSIGFKQIIYNLLTVGNYIENTLFVHRMYANSQFISILNKFIDNNLKSYPIADRDLINSLIAQNQNDLIAHPEAVKILFEILSPFEQAAREQAGGIEYGTARFSDSDYYIYPHHPFFDGNSIDFYKLGNAIYDILREQVTPIDELTLLDEIRREDGTKLNKNQKNLIDSITDIVPEFVKFTDEFGMNYYEIRFDRLSSIGDEIYRILYENGSPMSIADIEDDLKEKYSQFKPKLPCLTREQIQTNVLKNKKITYLRGKLGYYKLIEWDLQDIDQSSLILDALTKLGIASTSTEILTKAKEILPGIETPENILYTNISNLKWNKIFPLIKENTNNKTKYILKEWLHKYKGQIQEKPIDEKGNRRLEIHNIISKLDKRPISLRDLRNLLSVSHNIPKSSFDLMIRDEKYFTKTVDENGTILIDIVSEIENKVSLKDRIVDTIVKYLKDFDKKGNGLDFNKLVKQIHKQFFPTKHINNIYKQINARPDLFEKFESNGQTYIRYIAELDNAGREEIKKEFALHFDWEELKKIITAKLTPDFKFPKTPRGMSPLDYTLDLWYKFINQQTSALPALDVLDKGLLPSVWKYFMTDHQRHEEKLLHKDILTNLEVFTLKILYNVNKHRFSFHYNNLNNGDYSKEQSFGKYIDDLNNIDPNRVRYKKELKQVKIDNFGRQINIAYNMRNEVAHLGGDWDSDTINEVIICAMEYMIWAIYCYEKPLEKVL